MLDQITPVILTYNEEPNIRRVLEKLYWAKDIVVVDSHSQDRTCEIVKEFKNLRLFKRTFDYHAAQWNYAVKETEIHAEWILALDADYVLSEDLIEEIRNLSPEKDCAGYQVHFIYKIQGEALQASLYPPVTVLYRHNAAHYEQDGHTQRIALNGKIECLRNPVFHDDRKGFPVWFSAQEKYARLEAQKLKLLKWGELRGADKIRKAFLAPVIIGFYCLFYKKLIWEGRTGILYTLQRIMAEGLLVKYLLKGD